MVLRGARGRGRARRMVRALRGWHGAQPLRHRVGAEEVRKGRGAEPEAHVVNEAGRGGDRGEMSSKPMM